MQPGQQFDPARSLTPVRVRLHKAECGIDRPVRTSGTAAAVGRLEVAGGNLLVGEYRRSAHAVESETGDRMTRLALRHIVGAALMMSSCGGTAPRGSAADEGSGGTKVLSGQAGGALGDLMIATTAAAAEGLTRTIGITGQDAVDDRSHVLVVATVAESTGCPAAFHGFSVIGQRVELSFSRKDNCKADLRARTFAVIAPRGRLPRGEATFHVDERPAGPVPGHHVVVRL